MSTPQIKENSIHNQRKLQKRLLKKEIRCILQKFKLSDLMSVSVVNLFELSSEEIKEKHAEFKLTAKKDSVADLLALRAQEFSLKELEDIIYSLKLYRTVFTNKSKTWSTVSLLEPVDDFQLCNDVKSISIKILQALRIKGLNAVVKVVEHEEMFWVMIIEKKITRRKGIKLQTPVFFCFELGTPFIFLNCSVNESIMNCILRALQYNRHKLHNLQGRNLKSLLALLKHRAEHRNTAQLVPVSPKNPEIGHRYLDYSKRKVRQCYADKVFQTEEKIILETLIVNADTAWRDDRAVPSMVGEPFQASVKFKSKNLIEMMKYVIINDMVATPVPEYISSILRSGKNKIQMRIARKQ